MNVCVLVDAQWHIFVMEYIRGSSLFTSTCAMMDIYYGYIYYGYILLCSLMTEDLFETSHAYTRVFSALLDLNIFCYITEFNVIYRKISLEIQFIWICFPVNLCPVVKINHLRYKSNIGFGLIEIKHFVSLSFEANVIFFRIRLSGKVCNTNTATKIPQS